MSLSSAALTAFAMNSHPFRFHRLERLGLRREADRVIEAGRRVAAEGFLLHWCEQSLSGSSLSEGRRPERRISVRVSRDFGSAPRRNRAKRLVREIFRTEKVRLREGVDMVIRIRPLSNPDELHLKFFKPRVLALFKTAGLLKEEPK